MGSTVIQKSRRFWIWTTLGFAVVTLGVFVRLARSPFNATGLIFGLFFVALLVASARSALVSGIAFSFDNQGFTLGNGRRFVAWRDVDHIHVSHSGAYHELVLHLTPGSSPLHRKRVMNNQTNPDEITVLLDHLSMPWDEVARGVEAAAATPMTQSMSGPFGLGSRPMGRD